MPIHGETKTQSTLQTSSTDLAMDMKRTSAAPKIPQHRHTNGHNLRSRQIDAVYDDLHHDDALSNIW